MVEKNTVGDKSGGHDSHKTFDWQHVWKSVEHAGTQAGNAIKKQASEIDTKELGDKAKHAASDGLKVIRGKSDNKQANQVSDAAANFVPGAGLLRTGADLAHETGAAGKVLEGKKGPLRAPSERTMKEVGKEAIGTAIPIPGGGMLMNEVLDKSGVKDKVIDGAIDAAKNHGAKAEAKGKNPEHLPNLVLEDSKKVNVVDTAKDKVGKFFRSFHKPEPAEVKKK